MDILSLRDLPLAMAFGLVCLWFLNQNNIAFTKKLSDLIVEFGQKHEAVIELLFEERRQWMADQREQNRQLVEIQRISTEAHVKSANELHQLRNLLAPFVLNEQRARDGNERAKRSGGSGSGNPSRGTQE